MEILKIRLLLVFLAISIRAKLCCAMSDRSCDVEKCFENLLYNVDLATVDDFNTNELFQRLQVLLRRDYFRYFQYNSKRPCPFWNETLSGKCNLVSCRVTACKVNELPLGLQVSISPTFYEQLYFATKVYGVAFMRSQFGFVIFCRQEIDTKAAH